uniref:Phorbol-ester/DAG-type domain-containing protein n=1 Tax=Clastoptera arizonana TaxID=38151 RepID=A0A1B6CG85_9HEMI
MYVIFPAEDLVELTLYRPSSIHIYHNTQVSDFTQELSQMYEQHAGELQLLVANFRKKNAELRKERPSCPNSLFHTWEALLQEVEVDSQAHSDIASVFGRQVSRPLLERSFHRKVQARKVFTHRESFEVIINKAEDKLAKSRQDYKASYLSYIASPNNTAALAAYLDAHNTYVAQLHATNGMVEQYSHKILPKILQELEDIYSDLCSTLLDSVLQGAEVISSRATEQAGRYEALSSQCRAVMAPTDLASFVKSLSPLPNTHPSHRLRLFTPPQVPQPDNLDQSDTSSTDPHSLPLSFKNELVADRLASIQIHSRYETLRVEALELETQIKQLQDALDTMIRIQQRSLESALYNKVNEIQEDISNKRYDLRSAQIQLSSVKAQKELFASKLDAAEGGLSRDRKMSSSSTGSMKSKWLKAFKSLKTPTNTSTNGVSNKDGDKKNGRDGVMNLSINSSLLPHQFQEYTYKKITPCDVCSQVLRGHTRQGLKCRVCKLNVHIDCQEKVGKCQAKSRLLRRQKSTSDIETRLSGAHEEEVDPTEKSSPSGEVDAIYQVLKQAGEISSGRTVNLRNTDIPSTRRTQPALLFKGNPTLNVAPNPHASSSVSCLESDFLEFCPRVRSLGSSRRRPVVVHNSQCWSTPSSPVHNRRLLSARNMRMSSVELPDDNEKSLSSASTSPCPSPKPHRLLPTNLFVVLYNFKSRHADELDLNAGYKVTVIDSSDQDWWKGKCLGKIGYFPSKYVTKLQPGERALQVTHNLQVSDGDNGLTLLRDQIVIQIGEDLDGMVVIRSGDNRQGVCPVKFLQEV